MLQQSTDVERGCNQPSRTRLIRILLNRTLLPFAPTDVATLDL
jgi:hypothetical protein